jgi:hypothetical protein
VEGGGTHRLAIGTCISTICALLIAPDDTLYHAHAQEAQPSANSPDQGTDTLLAPEQLDSLVGPLSGSSVGTSPRGVYLPTGNR